MQYEKRAQCCRGREACCVRGVQTKTIPAKVKKAVRVVPPTKKADSKKKVSADKKKVAPKQYRWDVEYERQRVQQCCGAKRACCRAPTAMYRADVQYEAEPNWFVLSGSGERAVVVGDDELSMLQRIQNRQRLLHKLLLTHDSPLYDDLHWQAASDEHIVQVTHLLRPTPPPPSPHPLPPPSTLLLLSPYTSFCLLVLASFPTLCFSLPPHHL